MAAVLTARIAALLLVLPGAVPAGEAPPARLSETGLFEPGQPARLRSGLIEFSPQYPLWSDGARKRRWIRLPAGGYVDAREPDAWQFPPGTRLWKEFAVGRPVETRLIERLADGSWRYAAYIWNAEGTDADLAPETGARLQVAGAPEGRYDVPSQADCRACHEGAAVPVLGFSALQLSPDRDPLAPHAEVRAPVADLRSLTEQGWLRNLPPQLLRQPPRIAARSATERAALGYLHGNCGHCHGDPRHSEAAVPAGLILAQYVGDADSARSVLRSMLDAGRYVPAGHREARRVVPGRASEGTLVQRMATREPNTRMPPVGTAIPDPDGLALIRGWIDHLPPNLESPP